MSTDKLFTITILVFIKKTLISNDFSNNSYILYWSDFDKSFFLKKYTVHIMGQSVNTNAH